MYTYMCMYIHIYIYIYSFRGCFYNLLYSSVIRTLTMWPALLNRGAFVL